MQISNVKVVTLMFMVSTVLIILKKYLSIISANDMIQIVFFANFLVLLFGVVISKYKISMLLLALLFGITYIFSRNAEFLIIVLYLLLSKTIKVEKYCFYYFLINIIFFSIVLICNKFGFIHSSDIYYRLVDGMKENRNDYGFGNPNSVFVFMIPIFTYYIYRRFDCWNILDTIFYISLNTLVYSLTLSRTGLLVNIIALIFIYLIKTKLRYSVKLGIRCLIFFTIIASVLIAYHGHDDVVLNYLLSNRPMYFWEYLSENFSYTSILGQPVENDFNSLPLDNSYIPLLIYKGIIPVTFVVLFYFYGLKKVTKDSIYIISLYILIYSIFENVLLNIEFNLSLFLIYSEIVKSKK